MAPRARTGQRLAALVFVAAAAAIVAGLLPTRAPAAQRPATAASPADAVAQATITPWKPIFRGVERCKGHAARPRPLRAYAVRIDLREPTIRFLVTPANGRRPKDCDARRTSEFLAEFKCQVVINGSFFGPFARRKGDPQDVIGLSMSRGDLYSPANKFAALLISKDNKAWIARPPFDTSKAHNALAGDYPLLENGRNNGHMGRRHPRTAVGITKDGRYLILMVIDGRLPGYSEGTTKAETAEWMRRLGAYHALNLDGGGSSTLVVEGRDGRPGVANRPSDGRERLCPNHLGVYAERLRNGR